MEKTEIKGFTNETTGIICNKLMKTSIEYEKLKIENKALKKQLTLTDVGCSVIAEPYLISEKENQIEEMKKLGLFTEGILFEQSINGLIQVIKDLKEL